MITRGITRSITRPITRGVTDPGYSTKDLLFDLFPGFTAAYSLRKIKKAYTGPAIRVRRSSDSTEQDIGFSGYSLNSASLLAFCGAGNGFVTTIYDQIGSNNATQTTTGQQGTIVSSGSLIVNEHGNPAINLVDASAASIGQHFIVPNWHTASQSYVGWFFVYSMAASGTAPYMLGSDVADRGLISLHNTTSRAVRTATNRGGVFVANGSTIADNTTNVRHDSADKTKVRTYLNTTASADIDIADGAGDFTMPTNYIIGNTSSNTPQTNMKFSEAIFTTADQSAVQLGIRTDQYNFWTS